MFKANKKLGQHFLQSKNTLKKIVDSLDIKSTDTVVEIGPGHGELTEYLLAAKPTQLILIEKDPDLVSELNLKLKTKNLKLIEGDALKILPKLSTTLQTTHYKLCGNIPYYITGYLFRLLADIEPRPSKIVFTIQKEVADRICQKAPKMNLLAASVQYWAEPKIISVVKKTAFRPQPKVDSAIIELIPKLRATNYPPQTNYYKFIKVLFKQPRKTILNNLVTRITKNEVTKILNKVGIDPSLRPQNLSIEQIEKLVVLFK
ncbi:MAG: ribosomal RNA small subunit methyltransferase A [Candidatus Colwellbacteria bacterium]|nr:ribosomal RNA small subunit methyltransferase A [Candidatus Colwellbacteria bacterium]